MKLLTMIGALLALPVFFDLTLTGSKIVGRVVATWDIAHGHPTMRHAAFAPPWNSDYELILRDRYGIEFHGDIGCTLDEPEASYLAGYSEAIQSWALNTFHEDIVLEAMYEAGSRHHPGR
jgi:hypothetical protein